MLSIKKPYFKRTTLNDIAIPVMKAEHAPDEKQFKPA
jgi:hypothetical protein